MAVQDGSVVIFSCYSLKYMILNLHTGFILKRCISWMFLVCVLGAAGRGGRHLGCFIQQLCEEQSLCPPECRKCSCGALNSGSSGIPIGWCSAGWVYSELSVL